jgi:hypothetical protein
MCLPAAGRLLHAVGTAAGRKGARGRKAPGDSIRSGHSACRWSNERHATCRVASGGRGGRRGTNGRFSADPASGRDAGHGGPGEGDGAGEEVVSSGEEAPPPQVTAALDVCLGME